MYHSMHEQWHIKLTTLFYDAYFDNVSFSCQFLFCLFEVKFIIHSFKIKMTTYDRHCNTDLFNSCREIFESKILFLGHLTSYITFLICKQFYIITYIRYNSRDIVINYYATLPNMTICRFSTTGELAVI